ncbi:MAG: hypothetical protein OXS30_12855 [Chloroflexota bacterium]|nr:hypothetical protein [Chloroflexota bacterium]
MPSAAQTQRRSWLKEHGDSLRGHDLKVTHRQLARTQSGQALNWAEVKQLEIIEA